MILADRRVVALVEYLVKIRGVYATGIGSMLEVRRRRWQGWFHGLS